MRCLLASAARRRGRDELTVKCGRSRESILQAQLVQRLDRQVHEYADAVAEHSQGFREGEPPLGLVTFDRSWIGQTPMRCHGLAWPDRTNLTGRVITYGEHEIERFRSRNGELIPALRTKVFRRIVLPLQKFERVRMHFAFRKAARTEAL